MEDQRDDVASEEEEAIDPASLPEPDGDEQLSDPIEESGDE